MGSKSWTDRQTNRQTNKRTRARLDEIELFTPCEFFSYTLALVRLFVFLSRFCSPKERPTFVLGSVQVVWFRTVFKSLGSGLQVLRILTFIVLVMSELDHLRKKPPEMGAFFLTVKTGDSKLSVKSVGLHFTSAMKKHHNRHLNGVQL